MRSILTILTLVLLGSCSDSKRVPASSSFECQNYIGGVAKLFESERIIRELQNLRNSEPTRIAEGSATLVHRLEFEDSDLTAIFKEQLRGGAHLNHELSNTQAEVLAYELDRLLKLFVVPQTTSRTVELKPGVEVWGSLQQEMKHLYSLEALSEGSQVKNHQIWDTIAGKNPQLKREQLDKLSFFDYLIHNGDRHLNNVLIAEDGSIIAIDHGAAFKGHGKHLSAFYLRRTQIDRFMATDEGRRVVDIMSQLDRKRFKEFMTQYIDSYEARTLVIRMEGLLKRELHKSRFDILTEFSEESLAKFLGKLIEEKNYDEIQLLIEAADIDDQATNIISRYIYKSMDKAPREELLKKIYVDPESQLSHKMMVERIYGAGR